MGNSLNLRIHIAVELFANALNLSLQFFSLQFYGGYEIYICL